MRRPTRIMDAITVLVAELRGATPPAHRYDPDQGEDDPEIKHEQHRTHR